MLKVTIAINAVFLVVASLLLLGAHRHFHRAIAVPLRLLTERSHEIAAGGLDRAMPVTSTDEIGRLSHAFNRMAEQLRAHEEKLKGLAILEERERLARELHDDLAQDIAFLRLKLAEAERGLASSPDAETRTAVTEMLGIVDAAYQNLRTAIFGLRPLDVASSGGLMPALADYLDDFGAIRKIPVQLRATGGEALAFAPHTEQQLFRIVHEALTNVVKHAQATRAVVTLAREGDTARITVEDDGIGFVVDKLSDDGPHFGLQTMRERAQAAGGTLAIESAPGHGTKLIVHLPLARA
jgi:signal transduction histidine kinase